SALAHDINQPLSAAMSYVQAGARLIKGGKDPERTVGLLEKAVAEITHASQVIQRVRSFLGQGVPARGPADLSIIAHETIALLDTLGTRHHAQLDASIPLDLAAVFVDEVQIRQVLFNLVRNAV